ncbi:hypothetical protein MKW94_026369 [Papaver nudicaule]|uniref:Uncharacterized protein n=1 Tax=Papaver nudicaule TaxID=74823 RepID=A0AA41S0J6_PAPNU|nr:hypothetical protein [Papaver nudicaule]
MNKFGVLLLVLIASTSCFVDKAEAFTAAYWTCMSTCRGLYCGAYCFGYAFGLNKQVVANGQSTLPQSVKKYAKHSHPEHYRNPKHRRSKHTKHAHH